MKSFVIQKSTFDFLKKLSVNNNREWFASNKAKYEGAKENAEQFIDALIAKMNEHDDLETPSGKKSLYRIYNDVRFSDDKTPYNPRFAGYLKRRKPFLRGGYYFWIKPGNSRIACGFAHPNPDDLKRIRQDIEVNYEDWYKLLKLKTVVSTFGAMQGEQVRTAPRGFEKDHPAIGLLRFKQLWFERSFADKEVLADDFLLNVNKSFKAIRPFFDYVSEVLGTDLNGETL
ncbi:DUF2461 domain-containing protein [Chryseosolibacter indicus]|uniref:TIGR02453 family protein n=1 Tax=Chryseosolibacter indicus TaxID=2782351 RepID=A0ABS5VSI1_9BACT|nr:DUF2461 domain-containing protein [Chryseosolibacter indicus]MBT1703762.1 TIGR02453 family protein [Chryseosolibacter indicus]